MEMNAFWSLRVNIMGGLITMLCGYQIQSETNTMLISSEKKKRRLWHRSKNTI
jgi:hypothetical protein